MKDQFSLFLPEYLLSRTVFYITLVWGYLTHFIDSISGFQGRYFERIVIVFVMHLLTFEAIKLAKIAFIDYVKGVWIPVTLLIIVMLITGLRGTLLAYLYFWLGISEELSVIYRTTASLCNYSMAIFVATLTFGEITRHRLISHRLIDLQTDLRTINIQAESDLKNLEIVALENIQNQLRRIAQSLSLTRGQELRFLLKESIEQVIKPLTNEIYRPIEKYHQKNLDVLELKINWKQALNNYANPKHLEYWGLVPTLAIMAAPVIGYAYGVKNGAIAIVLFLITVTGLVHLIGQISIYICEIFNNRFCRTIFYFSTLCSALVMYQFILLASKIFYSSFNPFWEVIVFSFMIHQINAFANEARIQANENTNKLSEINDQLKWKNSRLRMQQNSRAREIANVLHGEIQARLVATYLNLESKNSEKEDDVVKELIAEIHSKIDAISTPKSDNLKIESVLFEISSMWSNVAAIKVESNEGVFSRINADQPCLSTVNILLNELVFNSIKHGNSKKIEICIELENSTILKLKVSNDGDRFNNHLQKGTGSKLLDEVSISWYRFEIDEGLITEVTLPII